MTVWGRRAARAGQGWARTASAGLVLAVLVGGAGPALADAGDGSAIPTDGVEVTEIPEVTTAPALVAEASSSAEPTLVVAPTPANGDSAAAADPAGSLAGSLLAATIAESEPNSTIATADVVATGSTIVGSTSGSSPDDDYFAVDLPSAGRVTLNLTYPSGLGTGSAYYVAVFDSSGATRFAFDLDGGDYDGSGLASQATFLPAGRFYVRVRGYSSSATWGKQYAFRPVFAPGAVETEPNDTTATADVVGLGATVSASALASGSPDDDYFAVDLPSAASVSVKLAFPAGLGTGSAFYVSVFNQAGATVASFDLDGGDSDGSTIADQLVALPAGRFYVRVRGYSGSATWGKQYDLTVSVPETLSVYRFWSPKFNNAHFFTMDAAEADHVKSSDKNWTYEGRAFAAWPLNGSGGCTKGSPVYRFWSPRFSSHFYTQNEAEKNAIIAGDRNWTYEGANYCALTSPEAGAVPLYRFWSPGFGKHFFTASQAEADHIRAVDTNWTYEGIAYYVQP